MPRGAPFQRVEGQRFSVRSGAGAVGSRRLVKSSQTETVLFPLFTGVHLKEISRGSDIGNVLHKQNYIFLAIWFMASVAIILYGGLGINIYKYI